MRFSDLLPSQGPKAVGRVVEAHWDPSERGIRFTIQFHPSDRRVSGVCRAGSDPQTGTFIGESELRAQIPRFKDLVVYENPGYGDPNKLSPEEFQKIRIEFNLRNLNLTYQSPGRRIDANTFLSRIFR
jgi:hypothetical protein